MRAAGEADRNSDDPCRAAFSGKVLVLFSALPPSTERRTRHQIDTGSIRKEETPPYFMHLAALESVCVGGVRRGELGRAP